MMLFVSFSTDAYNTRCWFSIINSLAIVLLLTGSVAMIMMRTLRRDFNRYTAEEKEELQERDSAVDGSNAPDNSQSSL